MKPLPQNATSSQWDDQLSHDLSFIKKHRRYPLSRMTIMPLVSGGLFFAATLIYFFTSAPNLKIDNLLIKLIFLSCLAALCVLPLIRYGSLIKFKTLKTAFSMSDNMKLLHEFLKEQGILVFRHPDAPEVFQIISRNIDAFGDESEITDLYCRRQTNIGQQPFYECPEALPASHRANTSSANDAYVQKLAPIPERRVAKHEAISLGILLPVVYTLTNHPKKISCFMFLLSFLPYLCA